MAAITVTNFGGEQPSTSVRALGGDAAQVNNDLYVGQPEFRPLQNDVQVAVSAVSNPRTLYRLTRTATGDVNYDPTTGWIAAAGERSYVKGPVNDERSERTYFTFDDGSAPPRVVDANGADRLMGVPAPLLAPGVTLVEVAEFTRDEAELFNTNTLVPSVVSAIIESIDLTEPNVRQAEPYVYHESVKASSPVSERGAFEPWSVYVLAPVDGQYPWLSDNRLGAFSYSGASIGVPVTARAAFATFNPATLATKLTYIYDPVTGAPLLDAQTIADIVAQAQETFDVNGGDIKIKRDEITEALRQFAALALGNSNPVAPMQLAAFYAQPQVAATLTSARDNAASALYDACVALSTPASTLYGGAQP